MPRAPQPACRADAARLLRAPAPGARGQRHGTRDDGGERGAWHVPVDAAARGSRSVADRAQA
eukprot:3728051-Prymnesium_polylepis.1